MLLSAIKLNYKNYIVRCILLCAQKHVFFDCFIVKFYFRIDIEMDDFIRLTQGFACHVILNLVDFHLSDLNKQI